MFSILEDVKIYRKLINLIDTLSLRQEYHATSIFYRQLKLLICIHILDLNWTQLTSFNFIGSLTSLQLQRKLKKIINRDCNENKYCGFPRNKITASIESFSSSCNNPTRNKNQLAQNLGATTLEHELIFQPKDDQEATPQSDLWRKWDAFYRFCRLYSVIGTVSTGLYLAKCSEKYNL